MVRVRLCLLDVTAAVKLPKIAGQQFPRIAGNEFLKTPGA